MVKSGNDPTIHKVTASHGGGGGGCTETHNVLLSNIRS
jgi:hypothetical protein